MDSGSDGFVYRSGAFEIASAALMIALGALVLAGTLTNINEFFGFAEFNQGL